LVTIWLQVIEENLWISHHLDLSEFQFRSVENTGRFAQTPSGRSSPDVAWTIRQNFALWLLRLRWSLRFKI
jgi:hypothetical protein